MSGVNKCDRCGNIIEKQEELHRLPDLDVANANMKDACQQCWDEFRWWWNNVIRSQ